VDWLLLTLVCAFSLASADALTKRRLSDCGAVELLVVRFGLSGLLLLPGLLLAPLPPVPPRFWGWLALLVPLELVAMGLYVVAIRDNPLSQTLPYLAFTPAFAALTGWALLGERVSGGGLAGLLLVVLGAWLLNRERPCDSGPPGGWLAPFARMLRGPGARLMLAVAAIYSVTAALGKAAMTLATPESFGAFYFATIGLVTLALVLLRGGGELAVLRRRPGPALAVAALLALMVVTHFLAIARVEVAYMIAVKRTSLLFGLVYGAVLFGERRLGRSLLAGATMVVGVALITMAG
jgi:drug/metabolite transporter (DMT)-like permease